MDPSAHPFLDRFTPDARAQLLRCIIREDYPHGAFLFKQGDPADGLHLVLEGEVEIIRAAGTHEKILNVVQPGDYFGEVAVLDGHGRSTSARTRGATSIAKIPGPILLEVLATSPGAATLALFQHVLTTLRKATDLIVAEVVHKEKLSLVGEMASSLMHDLRTPVTSIRLSADLIGTTARGGKVPQWCDGIRLQCDRLVGMAAELMEFSKGESKLAPCQTTTTKLLDQFQDLNESYLAQTGVDIRFKAEPAEIVIDSMRLQRVVLNLMTNAVEALKATRDARIDVRAWVKDSTFYLTVKDNGPGIPLAVQSQIFEPFVTHGKCDGTGLGMAIARNIVAAHGGTITFQTALNEGASFLITIPQPLSVQP
jgi:signal transduction histidine kinase